VGLKIEEGSVLLQKSNIGRDAGHFIIAAGHLNSVCPAPKAQLDLFSLLGPLPDSENDGLHSPFAPRGPWTCSWLAEGSV
jgi:hypothetical protein